jgi:hypothetical protein
VSAQPLSPTQSPYLVLVTAVKVLGRYVVELTFDTGEVNVVDLEPMMWSPVYQPLLTDYDLFRRVFVDPDAGTIAWPNGAGWPPDELYSNSKAAVPD